MGSKRKTPKSTSVRPKNREVRRNFGKREDGRTGAPMRLHLC